MCLGGRGLHRRKQQHTAQGKLLSHVDLQLPQHRDWQEQHCDIMDDIRDTDPSVIGELVDTRTTIDRSIPLIGDGVTLEDGNEQLAETPHPDISDQHVGGDAEPTMNAEDAGVEKQNRRLLQWE